MILLLILIATHAFGQCMLMHCKNIKFVLNHGMVISVASSLVLVNILRNQNSVLWCLL